MDEDQVDQSTENTEENEESTGSRESERSKRENSVFSTIGGARQVNVNRLVSSRTNPLLERIARLELNLATSNKNVQAVNSSTERSLIQINTSIVALQQSLKVISDGMDVSDKLEKIKDANDKARERQLAEQALQDGKEQVVEKKMQSALTAPLRKIGTKARSILASLVEFFNVTLLGFMGLKTVELISALASGNKEKLEEVKERILKQLSIAGGIFLAINAGFAIALRSLLRLGAYITKVAAANLLKKPIDLLLNLVTSGRFGGARPGTNVPPVVPTGSGKGNAGVGGPTRLGYAFFYGSAFLDELNQSQGQVPESLVTAGLRTGSFGLTYSTILKLARGARGGGFGGLIGGLVLDQFLFKNLFDPIGDYAGGIIRNQFGMAPVIDSMSQYNQGTQNLFTQGDEDKINVFVVDGEERASISSVPDGSNDASINPGVSSSNPDNPYVLNSIIEYNIIGV